MRARQVTAAACAAALLLGACDRGIAPPPAMPDVDPDLGKIAIEENGCLSCHVIPGFRRHAYVGPPLTDFSRRTYISGSLPNSAENLVRWLRDPQDVDPQTAMPDVGLSEAEARAIAAYLLSLD